MTETVTLAHEQATEVLAKLGRDVHTQFPTAGARLDQFDDHLTTLTMVVDHLFNEDKWAKEPVHFMVNGQLVEFVRREEEAT